MSLVQITMYPHCTNVSVVLKLSLLDSTMEYDSCNTNGLLNMNELGIVSIYL